MHVIIYSYVCLRPYSSMQSSLKRHLITKRSSDQSRSFCNWRGRRVGTAVSPNSLPMSHSIQVSLDNCKTSIRFIHSACLALFFLSDSWFYIRRIHFVILSPQIKRRFSERGWSLFHNLTTTGGGHRVEQGAWAEELGALEVMEEVEEEEEVRSHFCNYHGDGQYTVLYHLHKNFFPFS